MNTKEIITGLRYVATKRPLECILYVSAADALETLQKELSQAIAERTPHDYGLLREEATFLRKELDKALAEVKRLKSDRDDYARDAEKFAEQRNKARVEVELLKEKLDAELNSSVTLQSQRDEARAEVAQLKDTVAAYEATTVNQQLTVRPEPSRLEIAAMLLAALAGRESESWEAKLEVIWAVEQADALIAAAKEAK